eukprot:7391248-Prymnesium_polylepis.2
MVAHYPGADAQLAGRGAVGGSVRSGGRFLEGEKYLRRGRVARNRETLEGEIERGARDRGEILKMKRNCIQNVLHDRDYC